MFMRHAIVPNGNLDEVRAYLPANYSATVDANDPSTVRIVGQDSAGWSLDDYVIPRLASGLIFAREVSA